MIIVQGAFTVAVEDVERFLEESLEAQQISRAEKGCIEYVFASDPLEPGRVVLSERWQTRADLDAHITALMARRKAAAAAGAEPLAPLTREVKFFESSEIDL